MARLAQTLGFAVIALSVAACGGSKKQEEASNSDKYDGELDGGLNIARLIGTSKNPPDEFAVISKAPLEMPQDFVALPAPQPGKRSPRDPDPVSEARTALFGDTAPQAANARTSVAESALLTAAGASDPNIRTTLAAEQGEYEAEQNQYVLDRIIPSLRGLRGEDNKNIVDPAEERIRLNQAAAAPAARAARGTAIATIPSGLSGTPAPVQAQPVSTAGPAPTLPRAPSPTAEPVTGGELIYIPE